jgi:hypothetical protein
MLWWAPRETMFEGKVTQVLTYWVTCDYATRRTRCQAVAPSAFSASKARSAARKEFWLREIYGRDLCPAHASKSVYFRRRRKRK